MSRINIRYYKKHPPAQLTAFAQWCANADRALCQFGRALEQFGRALEQFADMMYDTVASTVRNPLFIQALKEAMNNEQNQH